MLSCPSPAGASSRCTSAIWSPSSARTSTSSRPCGRMQRVDEDAAPLPADGVAEVDRVSKARQPAVARELEREPGAALSDDVGAQPQAANHVVARGRRVHSCDADPGPGDLRYAGELLGRRAGVLRRRSTAARRRCRPTRANAASPRRPREDRPHRRDARSCRRRARCPASPLAQRRPSRARAAIRATGPRCPRRRPESAAS